MSQQTNRINIDPSTIDFKKAHRLLDEIEDILEFTVGITMEEKAKLIKLSTTRQKFTEKANVLAMQNPEFLPPYLKLEDFQNDTNLIIELTKLQLRLEKISSKIDSTLSVTKHENFLNATSFYRSTKNAAQSGVPGSDSALIELADYFNTQKAGGKKNKRK